MAEPYPETVVDKRCLSLADYAAEYVVGVAEQYGVILIFEFRRLTLNLTDNPQGVDIGAQCL